jgi:5'-methylthioadenosine phosphorylase
VIRLCKEENADIVAAKHLENQSKFAGMMTKPEAQKKEAKEKFEWLFPGYFS